MLKSKLLDKIIDWRIPFNNQMEMIFSLSGFVKGWINILLLAVILVSPLWIIFIPYLELMRVYGAVFVMFLIITILNVGYNIFKLESVKAKWLMDNICLFNQYE